MEAASLFASANALYVNEEYEEALKHYVCAVTLQDCAEHRICRAAAYLKVGKFSEALADAEAALQHNPSSYMALHWKGVALFYCANFSGAKRAFEESLRLSPNAKAPRAAWVRKCDAQLSGSTLPLGNMVAETSKATQPSERAAVTTGYPSSGAQPSSQKSSATAVPAAAKPEAAEPAAIERTEAAASSSQKSGLSISGRKQIRREWYQNGSNVFITIFQKDVEQERCKLDLEETSLSLSFPLPGATEEEYQLDLVLFGAIEPSACKLEVSKVKVEVALAKKVIDLHWGDLEKVEEAPAMPTSTDQPSYPTSNKTKRDWSQIDRDMENELKNEKPQGDEALNKLFREIYDRADEDTRRAMNKSFQTSGGTVLSTNWGEVAHNDYENKDRPTPPEGQEWRDWRKK